ncbi:hypothetical protein VNO77_22835 [Canavalia gladiata]|uniref:Uncharacterized protein n=1 Tax=Canavalia gladiata TaxID=3824 RepID=A0AAN9L8K7_CANGL
MQKLLLHVNSFTYIYETRFPTAIAAGTIVLSTLFLTANERLEAILVVSFHIFELHLNPTTGAGAKLNDARKLPWTPKCHDQRGVFFENQKMRDSRKEFPFAEEKIELQTLRALLRHDNHLMHQDRNSFIFGAWSRAYYLIETSKWLVLDFFRNREQS